MNTKLESFSFFPIFVEKLSLEEAIVLSFLYSKWLENNSVAFSLDSQICKDFYKSFIYFRDITNKLIKQGFVSVEKDQYTIYEDKILSEFCDKNSSKIDIKTESELLIDDKVRIIFDWWNTYKGKKKSLPIHPKTFVGWRSCKKLTPQVELAIKNALNEIKNEKKQEDDDVFLICQAISNYAEILLSEGSWWSYPWSIERFFMVHERQGHPEKKWWRFLPANFQKDIYFRLNKPNENIDELKILSYNKKILAIVEKKVKALFNCPNIAEEFKEELIKCTNQIENFSKQFGLNSKDVVEYLFALLNEKKKSKDIYPSNLTSSFTWSVLLPQYLEKLGIYFKNKGK